MHNLGCGIFTQLQIVTLSTPMKITFMQEILNTKIYLRFI